MKGSLNAALHALMGADPCESVCTHVITGKWTALGLASFIDDLEEKERQARRVRSAELWDDIAWLTGTGRFAQ